SWSRALRDLHSFPTRRSSDLARLTHAAPLWSHGDPIEIMPDRRRRTGAAAGTRCARRNVWLDPRGMIIVLRLHVAQVALKGEPRSEEHTSELQSRFDLVCRLL